MRVFALASELPAFFVLASLVFQNQGLHKVLNEYEFAIVYAIYFEQRSVAEVARQKHKTRQAINQTKIKALQKIKEAWGKDKNTAI